MHAFFLFFWLSVFHFHFYTIRFFFNCCTKDSKVYPICSNKMNITALASSSDIMRKVVEDFGLGNEKDETFVCLGGFKNVRAVYDWKEGLILELDETSFNFGTVYEVECETTDPERAKEMLEGFLKEVGVPYVYSQSNKFAIFRAGKLLQ